MTMTVEQPTSSAGWQARGRELETRHEALIREADRLLADLGEAELGGRTAAASDLRQRRAAVLAEAEGLVAAAKLAAERQKLATATEAEAQLAADRREAAELVARKLDGRAARFEAEQNHRLALAAIAREFAVDGERLAAIERRLGAPVGGIAVQHLEGLLPDSTNPAVLRALARRLRAAVEAP